MGAPSSRPNAQSVVPPTRRTSRAKRLRARATASDRRREVLGFRAELLMQLPAPPHLTLEVAGYALPIEVLAGPPDATRRQADVVYFDADEWAALVVGVEADRLWPSDFREICERKQTEHDFRLTRMRALSGGQPDALETWSVAEVIDRLGGRLKALSLDDLKF